VPVTDHPFRAIVPNGPRRPLLNVKLINPHTGMDLKTWALIDTGADNCVLPASFAQPLGHNLKAGDSRQILSASGNSKAYDHTMRIEIPGHSTEDILVTFLEGLPQPLLGVRNFLSNFCLTIDYPNERFSLKYSQADPDQPPLSWPTP